MTSDQIEYEETSCLLCGANDAVTLMKLRDRLCGVPGEFQIVRCRMCGHRYMNPRPTLETVGLCYPTHYGPHQSDISQAEEKTDLTHEHNQSVITPWYLSRWGRAIPGLRALYYWLTDTRSEVIPQRAELPCGDARPTGLELGCAHGRFLDELVAKDWEVLGVEPAAEPAEKARQKGHTIIQGTLKTAELTDQQFDALFAWMVIEHLLDPRAELEQIRRVLKPAGLLLFSIPNSGCWEPYFFRSYWFSYEAPRHLHFFTTKSIRKILSDAGFETLKIIHQSNVGNLIGSLGYLFDDKLPNSSWGSRLAGWNKNDPPLWVFLALAPLGKVLAWCRQGGRITIVARRKD